tara:strand:- start:287 stop:430 length:144 start_codon:yes stop_codon:yes gene_type:complete
MNDLYKDYLLGWASKYIDDVTDLEIKGDVIYLYVSGKKVGIIAYQKL